MENRLNDDQVKQRAVMLLVRAPYDVLCVRQGQTNSVRMIIRHTMLQQEPVNALDVMLSLMRFELLVEMIEEVRRLLATCEFWINYCNFCEETL